ncbi:transposase [Falsigemmobacter faecalis]|uniref:transposase n=1 Tax=Falsigemmobacter faecalis TaxID=2488730 RepID=UPI001315A5E2
MVCPTNIIQACLPLKLLFGLLLRQATGLIERLLTLPGLPWPAPDFSPLSRRRNTLKVAIPYQGKEGLHLLSDTEPLRRPWSGPNGEGRSGWRGKASGSAATWRLQAPRPP